MNYQKLKSIFVMIFILSVALTGCGSSQTTAPAVEEDTQNSEVSSEYPIVIQHAFGETIIESKPERVATIAWGNQDLPLALEIVPVGVSQANYGVLDDSGLLPWTLEKFKELGVEDPVIFRDTDGLDYEAISDVQPDVILAAYSGITQEEYDLLSQIAPVVAYPDLPWQTYWREQITINANGMGMQSEGEALVEELEALIAEKISEHPSIKGKKAAFFAFTPSDLGKFYIYHPNDPRAAYLLDLGMALPDSIAKLAQETNSFYIELSSENVDVLEDVEVVITYGNEDLLTALQADPLLGSLPAIKRGSVALIEDGTPLAASATPSALSIPATIDEYLTIIGEAADKVK
ncbi:MAG: iron-siderophore ABC transporter substrate-binding protein [Epulopiscium sp.]|nr:iron-siderophore ABC transporter substrate-binding protein [Candidatus Epulonipiscium sp.]